MKKIFRHSVSLLLGASLVWGCRPKASVNGSLALDSSKQSELFKSISDPTHPYEWTGRLVLPGAEQRKADGGVFFEVHNAPGGKESLVGSRLWLRYKNDPSIALWTKAVTVDVKFDDVTEKSKKSGNWHPERLNGMRAVAPLESLAGARAVDDVQVLLKNGLLSGNTIEIDSEPVQIVGRKFALVRFEKSSDVKQLSIRHYNPTSRSFDGPAETVSGSVLLSRPSNEPPVASLTDIEKSNLNPEGWYIYGEKKNGVFEIGALEPRRLTMLSATETYNGRDQVLDFVNNKEFAGAKYGSWRVIDGNTNASSGPFEGSEAGLVLHIFGWRKMPNSSSSTIGGVTGGHFAFGFSQIVKDRFTGEPRLDIEYKQVYASNPNQIVSGSLSRHAYLGDLKRGWMYTLPISDVVVRTPLLYWDYDFGGTKVSIMKGFARELEKMHARYRTGPGNGAALVNAATSCVQDSSAALYAALVKFQRNVAENPSIQRWLSEHPESVEADFMGGPKANTRVTLTNLIESVRKLILPKFKTPESWQENADDLAVTRRDVTGFSNVFAAVNQSATLFPRSAHQELLDLLVRSFGSRIWVIRSDGVGGNISNVEPLVPTSLNIR
jgi:predicted Abi (CAAX) family protease